MKTTLARNLAACIASILLLSSCAADEQSGNPAADITDAASEQTVTSSADSTAVETSAEITSDTASETATTAAEVASDTEKDYIDIDAETDDLSKLSGDSYRLIVIENVHSADLSVLSGCKNVKSLYIRNVDDVEQYIPLLKSLGLSELTVDMNNYSSEKCDLLFNALMGCSVTCRESSTWHTDNSDEYEGKALFYATPAVSQWNYSPEDRLISINFTNYSDEEIKAGELTLYRSENGGWTPVRFADGKEQYNTNLSLTPREDTRFTVSKDMLDYPSLGTGIYKACVNIAGEKSESEFMFTHGEYSDSVINMPGEELPQNSHHNLEADDIMTDAQREVFVEASTLLNQYYGCSLYLSEEYTASHTAEDFLKLFDGCMTDDYAYSLAKGTYIDDDEKLIAVCADRGGNISYADSYFAPVYSDEDELLFKAVTILWHEDSKYTTEYEEVDFHMVKTENGWRMDAMSMLF